MGNKMLVFDIWAPFGHYKVIYATTSALTYPIPFKTAIYGLIGNIIGLNKEDNSYLSSFIPGECKIGLQILNQVKTQRLNINLSLKPGPIGNSRKPTLVEHISRPAYRIYFIHSNVDIYSRLKSNLVNHTSVYTPCLGLAYLIANFQYVGEYEYENKGSGLVNISSIIPMTSFQKFGNNTDNEIIQIGQYAVEMNVNRDVTKREDILLERKGKAISAFVKQYQQINHNDKLTNIILF